MRSFWKIAFLLIVSFFLLSASSSAYSYQTKIINGSAAKNNSVVALVKRDVKATYWGYFCAGTVIKPRWIITAAHCLDPTEKIDVVVGRPNLKSSQGRRIPVLKRFIHPDYNKQLIEDNDFALLYLKNSVGDNVKPVEIFNKSMPATGSALEVFGWGAREKSFPTMLQRGRISLYSDQDCQKVRQANFVPDSMFCGLGSRSGLLATDSCENDSGGPVLYQNKLIGTVSFGLGCGISPGVYGKIERGRSWIMKRISQAPKYSAKLFKNTKPGIDQPFSKPPKREVIFEAGYGGGITDDGKRYQELFIEVSANRAIVKPKIQVFSSGVFCVKNGRCYPSGSWINMKTKPGGRSAELNSYSINSCASFIKTTVFVENKKYQEVFTDKC